MKIGNKNNNSFIGNLPKGFDLNLAFAKANKVYIATAFAHMTGWNLIKKPLKSSDADVIVISGLDFCQTEPALLKEWIDKKNDHIFPYIYSGKAVFHPKILIVESDVKKYNFAIVGSGNMSKGGFLTNVECHVFVNEQAHVSELIEWFKQVVENESVVLKKSLIEQYTPKYNKAKSYNKKAKTLELQSREDIESQSAKQAALSDWVTAVKDAKKYFSGKGYDKHWYKTHKQATKDIRRILNFPNFEFSYEEWGEFYNIYDMGNLIPVNKKSVYAQKGKLKKGLKNLINDNKNIAERVDFIIDNKRATGVKGVSVSGVSKILISHNYKIYPVMNGPVKNVLKYYGYKAPRGLSDGEKYQAFMILMQDFKVMTGARDMLELDCFFYWKNLQLSP